ncbi:MAG: DNA-processing protein DprA [Candidatus Sumerlaeota bacterium]|nr:DNA-processing protein DprA [Candidatus Sumerlaeota bacterium]
MPLTPGKLTEAQCLWLRLRHTRGMTRVRLADLAERFEKPERILGCEAKALMGVRGVSEDVARAILEGDLTLDLNQEIELIEKYQVSLVTRESEDYPANLRTMSQAPVVLYCMGTLTPDDRFAVTIVGTRNLTAYGNAVCEEVSGALAGDGLTVISGLAKGIDSAAHKAALKQGGRTLAVLGNGLARIYPEENESLAWQISRQGALLTEYGMRADPDKYNFPERNEILAGLGLATIVIEAPARSGALLTARAAANLGRAVYAVPGDVTRANSRGCHSLIREGATLIETGQDVVADLYDQLKELLEKRKRELEEEEASAAAPDAGPDAAKQTAPAPCECGVNPDELSSANPDDISSANNAGAAIRPAPVPYTKSRAKKGAPKKRARKPDLSLEEKQVLELIRNEALHFDALYEKAHAQGIPLDAGALSATLLQLELKELIRQAPGKMFIAEAPASYGEGEEW